MMGSEMSDYARQIQHGLALANRQMMERHAKLGQPLIIGALDGTWQEVDAGEYLQESKSTPWWSKHFSD